MTRRERILAYCIGASLGGVALVYPIRWMLVDPFTEVHTRINAERERGKTLRAELDALERVEKDWQAWTGRTLATEPSEAQRLFQDNLHTLLGRHGLAGPGSKDTKVSPGAIRRDKSGLVEVPVTISSTGTLKQVVGFLRDFYLQDYAKRIEKVTLQADHNVVASIGVTPKTETPPAVPAANTGRPNRGGRVSRPGGRSAGRQPVAIGPDGPPLSVSIIAATVVLPSIENIKSQPLTEIRPLEQGPFHEDVTAYNEIFDQSLFKPWQPPPPVVQAAPTPATQQAAVVPPPVVEPTPPPQPRAGLTQRVVITGTINGEPVAYVVDESTPDAPAKPFRHDEPIDDGVLRLIHRRGLVVRVNEQGTERDYFCPSDKPFSERVELNAPETPPEVLEALREEFASEPAQPPRNGPA